MEDQKIQNRGELQIFDTFEAAEEVEREEWMAMSGPEKMALLETLRQQSYPNEPGTSQGLQRIFAVID